RTLAVDPEEVGPDVDRRRPVRLLGGLGGGDVIRAALPVAGRVLVLGFEAALVVASLLLHLLVDEDPQVAVLHLAGRRAPVLLQRGRGPADPFLERLRTEAGVAAAAGGQRQGHDQAEPEGHARGRHGALHATPERARPGGRPGGTVSAYRGVARIP